MKTQTWGRIGAIIYMENPTLLSYLLTRSLWDYCLREDDGSPLVCWALRNYRENRENGGKTDNPKREFPDARFSDLNIKRADRLSSSKWPDKQGRYWWELTLEDKKVSEDYYWMKDESPGRGFPDKMDSYRYWFSVHHAPSGTKIEGFSVRPDREKGYSDKNGDYWSYVRYDECGPIKEWMEEKDRNYIARLQHEQEQSKVAGLRTVEEKQQQEQLGAEGFRLTEKRALVEERLRTRQEKSQLEEEKQYQFEEQKRLLAEEKAKKSIVPQSSSRPGLSVVPPFNIRYEDIQMTQTLGEGAFGVVTYGKWYFEDVAVKTLHLQKLSENALIEFKEEAAIMTHLHSDYIVRLKGVSLQPYALVMEYMQGGSLFSLLHSQKPLPMAIRHRIALDVAKELAFLHQCPPHGILHRDLKSQNVLLTEYLCAKLADFGLSKVRVESSRSQYYAQSSSKSVGTIPWMAPECFGIRPKYSKKSDMYAYGMVLWELISRRMPYEEVTEPNEIRDAIKSGEREEIPEQTTNPREEVPVSFKNVIRFCWFQEVDKRPRARDAIETLSDIAISTPSPSSGSSSNSSGSSDGLPSGFISNFSSFKH